MSKPPRKGGSAAPSTTHATPSRSTQKGRPARKGRASLPEQTELARLTRELDEARHQQAATADVLKAISRATFDLQTVLDNLVEAATRLCDADHAWLFQREGQFMRWAASYGHETDVHGRIRDFFKTRPAPLDRGSVTGRAALEARAVQVPDVLADPEYTWNEAQKIGGYRAALGVPLMRAGDVVGVIFVAKTVPQPFTAKQVEAVTTFADQAVIAIENTRLVGELRESLQQQTASADVLKVISRSTFDLQTVLDTLVESAARLCEAEMAAIVRPQDASLVYAASYRFSPEFNALATRTPIPTGRGTLAGRTLLEGRPVHIADVAADPEYTFEEAQRIGRFRAMLGVPLLRQGVGIGVIILTRKQPLPFTDKQIELVTTFADQAVIAIENVRLFEAEQQRTRELTDALEQQTATADMLKVISRSAFDLDAVLDTLTRSAALLCQAEMAGIVRPQDGAHYWVTAFNFPPAFMDFVRTRPILRDRGSVAGRALLEGRVVHSPDVLADPDFTYGEAQKLGGYRTVLGIPLLREGSPIGVIVLTRHEVQPFTDRQIDLVTTFANQAVIAIENVRLFEAEQQRTEELAETLEQQTATAQVLGVISSSPGELEPVFQAILRNATHICEARFATLFRFEDGGARIVSSLDIPPAFAEFLRSQTHRPGPLNPISRVIESRDILHVVDYPADRAYRERDPLAVAGVELGSIRTLLVVPMFKDEQLIGAIGIYRQETRPFADKQIELVGSFAKQAVIAIENTRLLNELREIPAAADRDRRRAQGDQPLDLRPARPCSTVSSNRPLNSARRTRASSSSVMEISIGSPPTTAIPASSRIMRNRTRSRPGAARPPGARRSKAAQFTFRTFSPTRNTARASIRSRGGYRTNLGVPLLREGVPIGVFTLTRPVVKPFTRRSRSNWSKPSPTRR